MYDLTADNVNAIVQKQTDKEIAIYSIYHLSLPEVDVAHDAAVERC